MKRSVIGEANAVGKKIDRALHGKGYTALGFIFCAGMFLALVLRRPKSLAESWS